MKRFLTTISGVVLLAYFAYIEVNNADGFFDTTAVLTLCAILLILLVSTYRKEFSHFVGITLYTFGLDVLAMNAYNLLLGTVFSGLLGHEFLIGLILIINAFLYRKRGWSLFKPNVSEQ